MEKQIPIAQERHMNIKVVQEVEHQVDRGGKHDDELMQVRYCARQRQHTLQDDDCNEGEAKLVRCHYWRKVLTRHIQEKGAGGDQKVERVPSQRKFAHFDPEVGVQDHDNHAND